MFAKLGDRRVALAAAALVLGVAGPVAAARAATIDVNTTSDLLASGGGLCSLREAVNDVDGGSPDGDCTAADPTENTIVLPAGDYQLTRTGADGTNAAGELVVVGNGTSLLTISGAGPDSTTIDASGLGDRVLDIMGPAVALQDLTIAHGSAASGADGGGINTTSGLTLTDVDVTDNEAGAGADADGESGGDGGGIYAGGTLTIQDSTISGNVAGSGGKGAAVGSGATGGSGGNGGNGGGIYFSSTSAVEIEDSTIASNFAGAGGTGGTGGANGGQGGLGGDGGSGGGIFVGSGMTGQYLTVEDSTFSGNGAGAGGSGGTGGEGADGAEGGRGGGGGSGGAAFAFNVTAVNSTLTGNQAGAGGSGGTGGRGTNPGGGGQGGPGGPGGSGGAVEADPLDSPSTLTNVTISSSAAGSAGAGGGGGLGGGGSSGSPGSPGADADVQNTGSTLSLQNSITTASPGSSPCSDVTDGGHNLGEDGCVSSNVGVDPMLGALADNGGPTETMALLPGSPAIDGVPPTGANCPPTDQRGVPRPQGPACDIGAFEAALPLVSAESATGVTTSGATLNATVTPNAGSATVQFQLGTSTAYDLESPVQRLAGVSPQAVSAAVAGLAPATTYHYRVVGTNLDGTTYGPDQTFTTPSAPGSGGAPGPGGGGTHAGVTFAPAAPTLQHSINHKKHSARFIFRVAGATGVQCSLVRVKRGRRKKHAKPAKPRYSACRSPKTYKHLAPGNYEFFVRGVNAAGTGAPATFKFKI